MNTQEIPREEWQEFLDDFSRQHEGWLVTVEVLANELGDQILARDWPLQGITYDGRHGNHGEGRISVIAGDDASLTHTVPSPKAVRFAQTDEGAHQGLQIESQDGPTTLVVFRSPMPPQMLDGA